MADNDIEKTADNATVNHRVAVIERECGYVKFSRGNTGNLKISFDKRDGEHEGHLLNPSEVSALRALVTG